MSTLHERVAPLLREVLVHLQDAGGSANKSDVLEYLRTVYQPDQADLDPVSGGVPRWENALLWQTTRLVKSGWMAKDGMGHWSLTDDGRDALERWKDPLALRAEAIRRFDEWLAARNAETRRAWLVRGSSVRGASVVAEWLEGGWVSIPASQLRPIEPGISVEDLTASAREDYDHLKHQELKSKVDEIVAFVAKMSTGDVVLTTTEERIYVGDVTGDWAWQKSEGGRSNLRRPVEWRNVDTPIDFADLPVPLPAKLASGSTVVDLTAEIDLIDELTSSTDGPEEEAGQPPGWCTGLPDPSTALADDLFVDAAWLRGVRDLLVERKQVIFYGPPGTGKTFLARKLAGDLVGPEQVRLVQFHPSYTYEDFFEGYRPSTGNGGAVAFELRPGPLRQLVIDANGHRDQAFVLIIDEINRANLAKVFGELYFLLEYRNEAVRLLYSSGDEPFTLPPNIYLIGTMNTADRSIALVDAAMRRRFAFVGLDPRNEPTRSLLRRWSQKHGLSRVGADLLDELNRRLDDPEFQVGPSYFMRSTGGDAFSNERLARIWSADIEPLLQEHFYGQWEAVAAQFSLASIRKAVSDAVDVAAAMPLPSPGKGEDGTPIEPAM